jgi:pimeloyl-ACP methyl ester carboxylesterase
VAVGLLAFTWRLSASEDDASAIRSERKAVGDAAVHYLVAGPEAGAEVMLLHGQRFTSDVWVRTGTIILLAERGYRVIAVDLPGSGKSEQTKQDVDKWLSVAVRELCHGRPVVVAPSMSGRYALPFLVSEPDRLAGFVAAAPAALEPFRAKLAGLKVPTLAIWGSKDTVVPPEQADWILKAIPNARRVIIPGARHASYLSNPNEFHDELLQFLASVASPATQPAAGPPGIPSTQPAASETSQSGR